MVEEAEEIVFSPEKINIGGVPGYTKADMEALKKESVYIKIYSS